MTKKLINYSISIIFILSTNIALSEDSIPAEYFACYSNSNSMEMSPDGKYIAIVSQPRAPKCDIEPDLQKYVEDGETTYVVFKDRGLDVDPDPEPDFQSTNPNKIKDFLLSKTIEEAPMFRTGIKMDMAPEVMAPRLKKVFDMVNGAKDPVRTPEWHKNRFKNKYGISFPERLKDINKDQALAMNKYANDMKNQIREMQRNIADETPQSAAKMDELKSNILTLSTSKQLA